MAGRKDLGLWKKTKANQNKEEEKLAEPPETTQVYEPWRSSSMSGLSSNSNNLIKAFRESVLCVTARCSIIICNQDMLLEMEGEIFKIIMKIKCNESFKFT